MSRKKTKTVIVKPEPEKPKEAVKRSTIILMTILLAILAAAVFSNALGGQFLLDDDLLIADNAYVKSFVHLPTIFVSNLGKGIGIQSHYYRPLQVFTYMVVYHFWKFDPQPYHAVNVILHILVVLCVFWMVRVLYKDAMLAFLTALLYAAHPIHSESVTYISGTGDCIVALFMLVSFILYVKYSTAGGVITFIALCASYVTALFAKENSLVLPILFLTYHYAFRKKINVRLFIFFLGLTAFYVLFRASLLKGAMPSLQLAGLIDRIPGFLAALTGYTKMLIAPFDLYMGHESRLFRFSEPQAIAGVIILCAILWLVFKSRKHREFGFFAFAWFFITLAPVSNFYPLTFYMADHYLYLPSIAFFLIIAGGLKLLYDNKRFKIYSLAIAAGLTILYSYLTINQNDYWKGPITFYERTLKYSPDIPRIYVNLGNYYDAHGEEDKAVAIYKKAIKINPTFSDAHHNLGVAYTRRGKYTEAEESLKKAIRYSPYFANAYNMLGVVYSAMGKTDEAIEAYSKGLELNPNNAKALNNLAALYYSAGKKEKSAALIAAAIKADPDFQPSYGNLGIIYEGMEKYADAIMWYKKSLERAPRDANTYNNLGNTYYKLGRKEDAMAAYTKCLSIMPNNVKALNNLGVVYADMGKTDEAVKFINKALTIDPEYKDAKRNLSVILSRQ